MVWHSLMEEDSLSHKVTDKRNGNVPPGWFTLKQCTKMSRCMRMLISSFYNQVNQMFALIWVKENVWIFRLTCELPTRCFALISLTSFVGPSNCCQGDQRWVWVWDWHLTTFRTWNWEWAEILALLKNVWSQQANR